MQVATLPESRRSGIRTGGSPGEARRGPLDRIYPVVLIDAIHVKVRMARWRNGRSMSLPALPYAEALIGSPYFIWGGPTHRWLPTER
jgi:hypothetical protein